MEIMDLMEDGTLTNQQAEIHFNKLEEPYTTTTNNAISRRGNKPEEGMEIFDQRTKEEIFTHDRAPNDNHYSGHNKIYTDMNCTHQDTVLYDIATLFTEETEENMKAEQQEEETGNHCRTYTSHDMATGHKHKFSPEVHVIQPTRDPGAEDPAENATTHDTGKIQNRPVHAKPDTTSPIEKHIESTVTCNTGEIQNDPVHTSPSAGAPVESRSLCQAQKTQPEQPVLQIQQLPPGAILVLTIPPAPLAQPIRPTPPAEVTTTHHMGNPNSKTATQTSITVNNLQEDLRRHSQLLRNHSAMNQVVGGPPSGLSSLGFHGETLAAILIVLAMIALAVYMGMQYLRKGVLCPSFLNQLDRERHPMRDLGNTHGGVRPINPNLIQMNTMPQQAPRIAILPGEYTNGKCWTAPNDNFANRYEQEVPKFHNPAPPPIFQSPANRPSFVVPQSSEKCG